MIKNKLGIDGSLIKPNPESSTYFTWIRCDMMVTVWLLSSVSNEIAGSVMYVDSAKHVWNDLRERFTQSNGPRVFHTCQNFSNLTQSNVSVSNDFTKVTVILICVCVDQNAKQQNPSLQPKNVSLLLVLDGFR